MPWGMAALASSRNPGTTRPTSCTAATALTSQFECQMAELLRNYTGEAERQASTTRTSRGRERAPRTPPRWHCWRRGPGSAASF